MRKYFEYLLSVFPRFNCVIRYHRASEISDILIHMVLFGPRMTDYLQHDFLSCRTSSGANTPSELMKNFQFSWILWKRKFHVTFIQLNVCKKNSTLSIHVFGLNHSESGAVFKKLKSLNSTVNLKFLTPDLGKIIVSESQREVWFEYFIPARSNCVVISEINDRCCSK